MNAYILIKLYLQNQTVGQILPWLAGPCCRWICNDMKRYSLYIPWKSSLLKFSMILFLFKNRHTKSTPNWPAVSTKRWDYSENYLLVLSLFSKIVHVLQVYLPRPCGVFQKPSSNSKVEKMTTSITPKKVVPPPLGRVCLGDSVPGFPRDGDNPSGSPVQGVCRWWGPALT